MCVCVCVQSCPTLCNPIDCSPPGSSVHEIFQARILEWVSASYSGDLPDPALELKSLASPALAARFFTTAPPAPFSSVTQSCPTLWTPFDPMDCSTPGFPVHHQLQSLLKLMSTESVMPSNHLILCHPLLLLPSVLLSIRVFSNESFFASGGQSIGASASASVLPMHIPPVAVSKIAFIYKSSHVAATKAESVCLLIQRNSFTAISLYS